MSHHTHRTAAGGHYATASRCGNDGSAGRCVPKLTDAHRRPIRFQTALLAGVVCSLLVTPPLVAARPAVRDDLHAPPEVLDPRTRRSDHQQDQLEAYALFATGRALYRRGTRLEQQQRGDEALECYWQALRKYQRAFRLDPRPRELLWQIVSLAEALGRLEEAARYAILGALSDPSDEILVARLAVYATEQGQLDLALQLYERLFAPRREGAPLATDSRLPAALRLSQRLEMGRLYFLTQQYKKASHCFSHVQQSIGNKPVTQHADSDDHPWLGAGALRTYQLFAEAHLEAGRSDRAERALAQAKRAGVSAGWLAVRRARLALLRDDPEDALEAIQPYFEQKETAEDTAPYALLAEALRKLERHAEIASRLESLHADDPQNVPLALFLAGYYLDEQQIDDAARLLGVVLGNTAGPEPPATPMSALRGLARVHRMRGDAEAVIQLLGITLRMADTIAVLGDEAQSLAEDDPLLQKAAAIVDRTGSAGNTPLSTYHLVAMAQWAIRAGAFDMADRWFRRAIDGASDDGALLLVQWGLALVDAEQYDRAAAVFQRAIHQGVGPDTEPAASAFQSRLYFYLAGALEMSGRTTDALDAARRAAKMQPDRVDIARREAWIYMHAGRVDDARRACRELLRRCDTTMTAPEQRDALKQVRFDLSNLCVQQNDTTAAEEWLEQILDEYPSDVRAQNDLGYLWADQDKHLHRALRLTSSAVSARPDNMAYRDSLGWTYFRLGRYEEAVEQLERAASDASPDAIILEHLGDAYRKVDRIDDARRAWQRAVEALGADTSADDLRLRIRSKLDSAG